MVRLARMSAAVVVWSALLAAPGAAGTFNSGSTGADGAFAPTCSPTPCTGTVALPASGVFNYTTGNVPAGVTVMFARNATNTSVTLLFTGDVTIAGTINLDAAAGPDGVTGTSFTNKGGAGGPGGFNGGAGGNGVGTFAGGVGLGPGGGASNTSLVGCGGGGGGFGTAGVGASCSTAGGISYGDVQLLPLIGGSGGGGGGSALGATAGAGGGGGGALLIASSGTITLTGTITARGGVGGAPTPPAPCCSNGGGGGAGGGIRMIATTLAGTGGTINAAGGASPLGGAGGAGRVRLEAFTNTLTANFAGVAPSVSSTPGVVFPASLPSLSITSVASVAAPAQPTGSYATPDVTLPSTTTSPVAVVVNATSIPDGTPVVLRGKPQTGAVNTVTTPGLSSGTASANLALDLTQTNVISAEATFQLAAIDVPIKVAEAAGADDPVTHVRVSAAFEGASQVAYITRAGQEIAP